MSIAISSWGWFVVYCATFALVVWLVNRILNKLFP